MVQEHAAPRQQACGLSEVRVEHPAADVLEHADAHERVPGPVLRHLAVIERQHPAGLRQAGDLDALVGQLHLRPAQGDAGGVNAVLPGRVQDEAAPAAADVEEALPGLQAQLAADEVQLAELRRLEVGSAIGEVPAGVDHPAVEEEPVEVVRDIVMVADGFAVALHRVQPPRKMCRPPTDGPRPAPAPRQPAEVGERRELPGPSPGAFRERIGEAEDAFDVPLDVEVVVEVRLRECQLAPARNIARRDPGCRSTRVAARARLSGQRVPSHRRTPTSPPSCRPIRSSSSRRVVARAAE